MTITLTAQQTAAPAEPFGLAVIVGSVRERRFGPVVADWFVSQAERRDDLTPRVPTPPPTPCWSNSPGGQHGLRTARVTRPYGR